MIINAIFTEVGNIKTVFDDGRTEFVPDDLRNRDRQELADWEAQGNVIQPYVPPVINTGQLDQETLNRMLAEKGSVFRGFVLVMLDEINILRNRASLAPRTVDQIKPAILTKMRADI